MGGVFLIGQHFIAVIGDALQHLGDAGPAYPLFAGEEDGDAMPLERGGNGLIGGDIDNFAAAGNLHLKCPLTVGRLRWGQGEIFAVNGLRRPMFLGLLDDRVHKSCRTADIKMHPRRVSREKLWNIELLRRRFIIEMQRYLPVIGAFRNLRQEGGAFT